MNELAEGTMVKVDGRGPWPISVDNGHAVWVPDLPDEMSYYEGWLPRAGESGGPSKYNRWVTHDRIQVIDGG